MWGAKRLKAEILNYNAEHPDDLIVTTTEAVTKLVKPRTAPLLQTKEEFGSEKACIQAYLNLLPPEEIGELSSFASHAWSGPVLALLECIIQVGCAPGFVNLFVISYPSLAYQLLEVRGSPVALAASSPFSKV